MFDPVLILLVFFGGGIIGFIEARVRRRGRRETVINVLVGAACGLVAAMVVGTPVGIIGPMFFSAKSNPLAITTLSLTIYLAPIVGGFVGVTIVLKSVRH